MRWMRPIAVLLLLGVWPDAFAVAQDVAARHPDLDLTVEAPAPETVIGDPGQMAFVAGRALAHFGEFQTFDLVFVLDTSQSTSTPSGADIDGDGVVGHRRGSKYLSILGDILPLPNSDGGDSILAAEIAAVKMMLDQLDPRTTRVGIVSFAGDHDSLQPDAFTEVPLSTDFEKVRRGLDDILDRGPAGMTNMVSAVNRATVELLGTQSAYSEKREGARKVILFLTDGVPTLPFENSRLQNARMAISKAMMAAKHDIRIDTFAIGPKALEEPVVVVEMARVSLGVFTPILEPKNLRAVFEQVDLAEIEELRIRNRSNDKPAIYQIQNPDGSFAALVPVKVGRNTLEVFARTTNGTEATRTVTVRYLDKAGIADLPPRLLAQRNRLMENRLLDLQRRRLEIETARDDDLRKDLQIEIEKERVKAERRADELRRDLEIEVDPDGD